jgi:hypothetical protein
MKGIGLLRREGAALSLLLALALPCGSAWSLGFTLSRSELAGLMKVVNDRGSRTTIPAPVASVLQLQAGQISPDIKQAVYVDGDGNRHGFAPLSDHSGYFMFTRGQSMGHAVYVVDPALHLMHAARSLQTNGPLIALPVEEAQRELEDEFRRWSKLLSPNGPSVPGANKGATAAPDSKGAAAGVDAHPATGATGVAPPKTAPANK